MYLKWECEGINKVIPSNFGATDQKLIDTWDYPITYSPGRSSGIPNGYTKNPKLKVNRWSYDIMYDEAYTVGSTYLAVMPVKSKDTNPEIILQCKGIFYNYTKGYQQTLMKLGTGNNGPGIYSQRTGAPYKCGTYCTDNYGTVFDSSYTAGESANLHV